LPAVTLVVRWLDASRTALGTHRQRQLCCSWWRQSRIGIEMYRPAGEQIAADQRLTFGGGWRQKKAHESLERLDPDSRKAFSI
jgi:hypothetical protein